MPPKLRLGSISFINSLPVDLGLISGKVGSDCEIITGTPAALNEKILKKEIDISPVSTLWYAEYQDQLLLLPDLSISSESGVESVLLFSRFPIKLLKGRQIAVTRQGRTTPALLEMICRFRYGFRPDFKIARLMAQDIPEDSEALLLIGNEALQARENLKNSGYVVTDLAEEWKEWTSLPFVFAVWVVRRDSFLTQPKKVYELHQALLESKKWGAAHLAEILKAAEAKIQLPEGLLKNYFSCLSYDFNEGLKCGLRLYYEYAARCGLLKVVKDFEEIPFKLDFVDASAFSRGSILFNRDRERNASNAAKEY